MQKGLFPKLDEIYIHIRVILHCDVGANHNKNSFVSYRDVLEYYLFYKT